MSDLLQTYVERIRAAFPALAISSIRMNSDGLANAIVIVNDEIVFRFPKNEHARGLLAHEVQILQIVRRYVSLPVPQFEHQEDDFVMYRFIPGKPLYRNDILRSDERRQVALAKQLATFLRQLHAIPLSEFPRPGTSAPAGARGREFWLTRLQDIERELFPLLWADQKDWVAELFAPLHDETLNMNDFTPALIHRDLASYHILYDPDAACITGVIDFGTAGPGDPAVDVACLINTYGESFLHRMHSYYPINQRTLDRARFLAGALELEWALNGIRSQDPSWLLVHLGRARDVLPIGAR